MMTRWTQFEPAFALVHPTKVIIVYRLPRRIMLHNSKGIHNVRHSHSASSSKIAPPKKEKKIIETGEKEDIARKIKESVREARCRGWKQAKVYIASEVDQGTVRKCRMTVDEKLTWTPHMLELKKSFAKKLGLIKVARVSIFIGTPSIFESLILKQIDLYCKTIMTHGLHLH